MQNYVIEFEPYNERLRKLRIKGKYNNITLINVYAPTEDHTEETKEQFYDNLQYLLDKTPKRDIIIILGDVNAQLGKESLHEETNINGEVFCEFAYAYSVVVMSAFLLHCLSLCVCPPSCLCVLSVDFLCSVSCSLPCKIIDSDSNDHGTSLLWSEQQKI
jgi:hypothetical protein